MCVLSTRRVHAPAPKRIAAWLTETRSFESCPFEQASFVFRLDRTHRVGRISRVEPRATPAVAACILAALRELSPVPPAASPPTGSSRGGRYVVELTRSAAGPVEASVRLRSGGSQPRPVGDGAWMIWNEGRCRCE
jgi:hypothetical protein